MPRPFSMSRPLTIDRCGNHLQSIAARRVKTRRPDPEVRPFACSEGTDSADIGYPIEATSGRALWLARSRRHSGRYLKPRTKLQTSFLPATGGLVHWQRLASVTRPSERPARSCRDLTAIVAVVNVLLIDDDSDDAYLIRRELERYGIEVEWAHGYQAGVDRFDGGAYDAVLVDQFLGVRTGLEFLALAAQRRPEVPVILVTGTDSREVDDAALEAGAAGFVLKDDARGDLLSRTIRYAVRGTRGHLPRTGQDLRPKAGGKDLTLQVALSRGMTIRDAASAAGMSERTAYRRMNDPIFQEQRAELESELRDRMVDRTVDEILNSD